MQMSMMEVFMRYVAHFNEKITDENRLRTQCFYMVAPYWDAKKNGKLRWLWQLWDIPEIDKRDVEKIGYTTIRPMTESEKKLVQRLNERSSHR